MCDESLGLREAGDQPIYCCQWVRSPNIVLSALEGKFFLGLAPAERMKA